MTRTGMERVIALAKAGLPVFVVGTEQLAPLSHKDLGDLAAWGGARSQLLALSHVVGDYGELLGELASCGVDPDAAYLDEHVLTAHIRRGDEDLYLLYNGNRTGANNERKIRQDTIMPAIMGGEAFRKTELDVELSGTGGPFLFDLASGAEYALVGEPIARGVKLRIPLDGDQMVVVGLSGDVVGLPTRSLLEGHATKLDGWSCKLFRLQPSDNPCDFLAGGFSKVASVDGLSVPCAFDEVDGCAEAFAGYGEYRSSFVLAEVPNEATLRLPAFSDALELEVNGRHVPVVAGLDRGANVRSALRAGENDVVIRVYTNLSNALDKGAAHRYGLFGDVWLVVR